MPLHPSAFPAKATDYARLERIRRGSTVLRYHTHRVQRPQSVGEHSHGVAMLLVAIFREAYGPRAVTSELLLAALEHDLAEFEVGDSPAPAKRRSPALKAALDAAELDVDNRWGFYAVRTLTEPQARLLGACDELEFLFYAFDEIRQGNADFIRTFHLGSLGFRERLDKLPAEWRWIDVARNVHADLYAEVAVHLGFDRMESARQAAADERRSGR